MAPGPPFAMHSSDPWRARLALVTGLTSDGGRFTSRRERDLDWTRIPT